MSKTRATGLGRIEDMALFFQSVGFCEWAHESLYPEPGDNFLWLLLHRTSCQSDRLLQVFSPPQRSNWLKPEPSNYIFGLCVNWPPSRIISESSHHKLRCDSRGLEITKTLLSLKKLQGFRVFLPGSSGKGQILYYLMNWKRKGRKFLDLLIPDPLPNKGLGEILSESWPSLKFYQEVKNKNR